MSVWKKKIPIFLAVATYFFTVIAITTNNKEQELYLHRNLFYLPKEAVNILTIEFQGLVSDFFMLNTLTFMGEKILKRQKVTSDEWQVIYKALTLITHLDPMAKDPYILAETTLPFEAGMIKETNIMLEKAALIHTDDYRFNFFLWYNHFYLLKNPKKAAGYLEKAAKSPKAPYYFTTLAARMHLYAGQLAGSIMFLEEMLKETQDPNIVKNFELRLEALKKIYFLEKKVKEYKNKFSEKPSKLDDLIQGKIIPTLPIDPYGGTFYLLKNGRVYTTSELVMPNKKKKN